MTRPLSTVVSDNRNGLFKPFSGVSSDSPKAAFLLENKPFPRFSARAIQALEIRCSIQLSYGRLRSAKPTAELVCDRIFSERAAQRHSRDFASNPSPKLTDFPRCREMCAQFSTQLAGLFWLFWGAPENLGETPKKVRMSTPCRYRVNNPR
jgi:hypothetical protein